MTDWAKVIGIISLHTALLLLRRPLAGQMRHGRDYYVKHGQPKRLFVKELCQNARRSLQAQHLKPALARVEDPVAPRCTQRVEQLGSKYLRTYH